MSLHKKGPVTEMKEELEKTKQEAKANYDKYLRAVAEFDNYRKRIQKETEDYKEYAQASLLLDLVPVLENFSLAISHIESNELVVPEKEDKRNEPPAASELPSNHLKSNWLQGIKIIYNQIKDILAKYGFQEYSCIGQEFDPKKCEAINFIETDEKPANIVSEEVGKGYMLKNRVIRPAIVIVTKPKSSSVKTDQDKSQEKE
jgi:molecular chaperone GrpE